MRVLTTAVALFVLSSLAHAQDGGSSITFGISPHVSTLGVGADVGVGLHPRITVRAGASYIPFKPSISVSDTEWEASLPEMSYTGTVDLYLIGGLHVSGGFRYKTTDVEAVGNYTGTVNVGDQTFTGDEVGTLTGVIVTKDLSPYAGIGFGNVAKRGLGFILDFGVAFHGSPEVTLTSEGGTLSGDPLLDAELAKEADNFEEEIPGVFDVYPVLTVGLTIGF
jgi:hypothetical protein